MHGLAFLYTLAELNLSGWQTALSLLRFNLGMESMQLIAVTMLQLIVLSYTPDIPRYASWQRRWQCSLHWGSWVTESVGSILWGRWQTVLERWVVGAPDLAIFALLSFVLIQTDRWHQV